MENQLTILSESLDKKLEVLQKIREYNKRQEEIFSAEEVDMSLFDDAVEEKQRLIDEVVHLDFSTAISAILQNLIAPS